MLQRLFGLLVMGLFGWLLSRLLRAAPPARSKKDTQRNDGSMVRDRVCNTYLPESNALIQRLGPETHYFCSEACRRRFLEGRRAAGPA